MAEECQYPAWARRWHLIALVFHRGSQRRGNFSFGAAVGGAAGQSLWRRIRCARNDRGRDEDVEGMPLSILVTKLRGRVHRLVPTRRV